MTGFTVAVRLPVQCTPIYVMLHRKLSQERFPVINHTTQATLYASLSTYLQELQAKKPTLKTKRHARKK